MFCLAFSIYDNILQLTLILILFFFFSGCYFLLIGFPMLMLVFVMIYGGVTTTLYLFIMQIVRVNRYLNAYYSRISTLFCFFLYVLLCIELLGLAFSIYPHLLQTFSCFFVEHSSLVSYSFFEEFELDSNDSLDILLSCLVCGLRISLLLVCIEFTNFVLHESFTRNSRSCDLILLT